MYSEHFANSQRERHIRNLLVISEQFAGDDSEWKQFLCRPPLNLHQVGTLMRLACRRDDVWEATIVAARKLRKQIWQNRVFLMPPVYVSNGNSKAGGCADHCLYCPWRNNNVPRDQIRQLSEFEVQEEVGYLLSLGYGDVELVAATDPVLLKSKRAAELVASAKQVGAYNVGVNFFPLYKPRDYATLADAGCSFAIVWQETYSPEVYREMHPRGPKSDFDHRLDAHDLALQGGIRTVGVAFLGGLADWRFDALATLDHAFYLRKEYGANIIFGMPRWKSGGDTPMHVAPAFYGDREYELVGALYSLAIPESLVWFSTREHFDLSGRCAKGGGCLFTLNCSTEVGGYMRSDGFPQFPVYSRPFMQGVEWLKKLGYDPQTCLPW